MKMLLVPLLVALGLYATVGGDELKSLTTIGDQGFRITNTTLKCDSIKCPQFDSLTARVGRLEKRAKPTLFEEVAGFLLGGLIGLGFWGWINGLVHKHKKWMEVHK